MRANPVTLPVAPEEPSAESLAEIPEVDFSQARHNPYVERYREGVKIRVRESWWQRQWREWKEAWRAWVWHD